MSVFSTQKMIFKHSHTYKNSRKIHLRVHSSVEHIYFFCVSIVRRGSQILALKAFIDKYKYCLNQFFDDQFTFYLNHLPARFCVFTSANITYLYTHCLLYLLFYLQPKYEYAFIHTVQVCYICTQYATYLLLGEHYKKIFTCETRCYLINQNNLILNDFFFIGFFINVT